MSTDKELLELAAKAAGYNLIECDNGCGGTYLALQHEDLSWDPLTDDGDALRLAVKLQMHFHSNAGQSIDYMAAGIDNPDYNQYLDPSETKWLAEEDGQPDPYAAARRAIVRAAATIGKAMP